MLRKSFTNISFAENKKPITFNTRTGEFILTEQDKNDIILYVADMMHDVWIDGVWNNTTRRFIAEKYIAIGVCITILDLLPANKENLTLTTDSLPLFQIVLNLHDNNGRPIRIHMTMDETDGTVKNTIISVEGETVNEMLCSDTFNEHFLSGMLVRPIYLDDKPVRYDNGTRQFLPTEEQASLLLEDIEDNIMWDNYELNVSNEKILDKLLAAVRSNQVPEYFAPEEGHDLTVVYYLPNETPVSLKIDFNPFFRIGKLQIFQK